MWVTGSKLDEMHGYTVGQRKGRRQRGLWRQGIEWAWVDGAILYNIKAIDLRGERAASDQVQAGSQSRSKVIQLL